MRISLLMVSLVIVLFALAACEKGASQASEGLPIPPPTPEGGQAAPSGERDLVGQTYDVIVCEGYANTRDSASAYVVKTACTADAGTINVVNTRTSSTPPLKEVLFYPATYDASAETNDILNVEIPKPTDAGQEYFMYKKGYIRQKKPADAWVQFDWVFDTTVQTGTNYLFSLTNTQPADWYRIHLSTNPIAAKFDRKLTAAAYDATALTQNADGTWIGYDEFDSYVLAWICKCTSTANCRASVNWQCNSAGASLGDTNGHWNIQYFKVYEVPLGPSAPPVP